MNATSHQGDGNPVASRAQYRETREDIDNDTIKVSPLPEESTRVLYGWIGAGVERKRRHREPAATSIRSIDVNNTYYYFIWIESPCFSLSLSLFGRNRGTHIVTILSNFFSQSRQYATSLRPFPCPNSLLFQYFPLVQILEHRRKMYSIETRIFARITTFSHLLSRAMKMSGKHSKRLYFYLKKVHLQILNISNTLESRNRKKNFFNL